MIRSRKDQEMYMFEMIKKNVAHAWIGVHDQFKEGLYLTVLGERLRDVTAYQNWMIIKGKQQPTNWNNQDCVNIVKNGGGMDDNWCRVKMSYICEERLSPKARYYLLYELVKLDSIIIFLILVTNRSMLV